MIGSGLKKFAEENGLKVAKGVGYGSLQGFAVTLSEGSGYKQAVFVTKFSADSESDALIEKLNAANIQRNYRVQNLSITPETVQVVFTDNPGTMKKIREFMDWFLPLLQEHGASQYNVCPECGGQIVSGKWILINGVAFYMHDACAEKTKRSIAETEEAEKQEREGSYATGAVGAFIGAALGAVVWGLVLSIGYMASLVGLLIGWLAGKGYDLLKGKQGKGKVAILIFAVIFGVLAGTVVPEMIGIAQLVDEGVIMGVTMADVPALFLALLLENGEYLGAVGGNLLMGLIFAALGVIGLIKKTGDAVSGTKIVDLE